MKRHPKLMTRAIHAFGALIAFNQELNNLSSAWKQGFLISDPMRALHDVIYGGTGIDTNTGQINYGQTQVSVFSKIAGFATIKGLKFLRKHMRF